MPDSRISPNVIFCGLCMLHDRADQAGKEAARDWAFGQTALPIFQNWIWLLVTGTVRRLDKTLTHGVPTQVLYHLVPIRTARAVAPIFYLTGQAARETNICFLKSVGAIKR
jgi:hypothetical protein